MLVQHFQNQRPSMMNNAMRQLNIKRLLKFMLPLCGVVVLGVVFLSIAMRHKGGEVAGKIILNQVTKVKYAGAMAQGNAFSIQSERGTELSKDEISFEKVNGSVDSLKGEAMTLTANEGLFNKNNKSIKLSGDVLFSHENGLKLRTNAATLDCVTGDASGEQPIEGKHNKATIKAKGFRVEKGTEIVFLGEPELVLHTH